MIISSHDYKFIVDCAKGSNYSMARSQMKFLIEINELQIVTSDKISPFDLLKKTYRSKYTGDMMYKIK